MNFDRLFEQIAPDEIRDDVFTLTGKVFPVVTAGTKKHYNSMTASGGGMGLLFKKPHTWCIFPQNRYTLELIKKQQTYTLSYFPHEYMKQVLFLGSKSGKDSDKMNEVELTSIETTLGNVSYKEARLIIECKLVQISIPNFDDFYTQEAKGYLTEAYKEAGDIRQYVFGEIMQVWEKKIEKSD